MKERLILLIAIILFSSCSQEEEIIDISEEQVIIIGNKLAKWGNSHCSIITVNNNDVLWQGPNAGGCSTIYFEYLGTDRAILSNIDAYEESLIETNVSMTVINSLIVKLKTNLNNENKVKANLKFALESGNCDISKLLLDIDNIEDKSNNELLDFLSCLDDVKIIEGYSGKE